MLTLLAIIITWYLTKVYYTRSIRLKIDKLGERGLVRIQCSKCSEVVVVSSDNLRVPFYCTACK